MSRGIETFFACEPVLVDTIKTNIPELEEVNTPFSIEEMIDNSNANTAVSIIYYSDRVSPSVGKGTRNAQYQQWLVVLSVHDHQAQSKNTNTIREKADPLIIKLLDCLKGIHTLPKGYRELKRVDCPVTVGSSSGYSYFPFLFEVQMFT